MDSTPRILPNINPLVTGPPLVGVTLNWWLYGILIMQYFTYMNDTRGDRKWLQVTVHFIFLVDTIQTFMSLNDVFYWFVYHFGDPSLMNDLHLASITGPFLDTIVACIVQLVYGWRIWMLSGWRVLPAVIVLLALSVGATGVFVGVHVGGTDAVKPPLLILDNVIMYMTILNDIMIASCMTYLLFKLRPREASQKTMAAIRCIILLTLETNALSTLYAALMLVFFLVPSLKPGKTNLYLLSGYGIGKIYSNSFMVLLNQRNNHSRPRTANPEEICSEMLTSMNRSAGRISALQFSAPTLSRADSSHRKRGQDVESSSNNTADEM